MTEHTEDHKARYFEAEAALDSARKATREAQAKALTEMIASKVRRSNLTHLNAILLLIQEQAFGLMQRTEVRPSKHEIERTATLLSDLVSELNREAWRDEKTSEALPF